MDSEQPLSRVPKFGDWDSNEENVTYTAAFEGAARGRGSRINPNDPEQNPAAFAAAAAAASAAGNCRNNGRKPKKEVDQQSKGSDEPENLKAGSGMPKGNKDSGAKIRDSDKKPQITRLKSRENKDPRAGEQLEIAGRRQSSKLGVNKDPCVQTRDVLDQPEMERLQSMKSGGHLKAAFVDGFRRSRRANSIKYSEAADSPGQRVSSMRTKADIEIVERVQGLPKFGEWNENNPSAEGFTIIFNQARSEKKAGGMVRIPTLHPAAISPRQIYYGHGQKPQYNLAAPNKQPSIWACCFSPPNVQ